MKIYKLFYPFIWFASAINVSVFSSPTKAASGNKTALAKRNSLFINQLKEFDQSYVGCSAVEKDLGGEIPDDFSEIKFKEFHTASGTVKTSTFMSSKNEAVVRIMSVKYGNTYDLYLNSTTDTEIYNVGTAFDNKNGEVIISYARRKNKATVIEIERYNPFNGECKSTLITMDKLLACKTKFACWNSYADYDNIFDLSSYKIHDKSGDIAYYVAPDKEGFSILTIECIGPYNAWRKGVVTLEVMLDSNDDVVALVPMYSFKVDQCNLGQYLKNSDYSVIVTWGDYYKEREQIVFSTYNNNGQLTLIKSFVDERQNNNTKLLKGPCVMATELDKCDAQKGAIIISENARHHYMSALSDGSLVVVWSEVSQDNYINSTEIKGFTLNGSFDTSSLIAQNNDFRVDSQHIKAFSMPYNISNLHVASDNLGDNIFIAAVVDRKNVLFCTRASLFQRNQNTQEKLTYNELFDVTTKMFSESSSNHLCSNAITLKPKDSTIVYSTLEGDRDITTVNDPSTSEDSTILSSTLKGDRDITTVNGPSTSEDSTILSSTLKSDRDITTVNGPSTSEDSTILSSTLKSDRNITTAKALQTTAEVLKQYSSVATTTKDANNCTESICAPSTVKQSSSLIGELAGGASGVVLITLLSCGLVIWRRKANHKYLSPRRIPSIFDDRLFDSDSIMSEVIKGYIGSQVVSEMESGADVSVSINSDSDVAFDANIATKPCAYSYHLCYDDVSDLREVGVDPEYKLCSVTHTKPVHDEVIRATEV